MKNFYSCLLAFMLGITVKAQTPPRYTGKVPAKQMYRIAWTKEKWQGDDKPYHAVRAKITEALKAGKSPSALIAQYKKEYEQKPTDNLKLFGWASAVVLSRTMHLQDVDVREILQAFEKSKPPYTYEFMRMRYLAGEQQPLGTNDYTTALGERLAACDKNDFDLFYFLCMDISTNIPGAKEKSLGYAHRLIEIDPNRGTGYGSMAGRYYFYWALYGENREDAKQSLYWNEEYIKHEQSDAPVYKKNKEYSRLVIKKLQRWLAEHK